MDYKYLVIGINCVGKLTRLYSCDDEKEAIEEAKKIRGLVLKVEHNYYGC